jgi:hypothetical protein
LIDLRNGTAHTTVGDQAKALLPTLAETVALLLKEVGFSVEQFWGRWTSAVNVAVDKQRDAIQRDVEVRIKQARHLFEDRFDGLPDGVKETALQEPDDGVRVFSITDGDDDGKLLVMISTLSCPACGAEANVQLLPVKFSTTGVELLADLLSCPLCGLELNSPEEIKASGADITKAVLPSNIAVSWAATLPAAVDIDDTHAG